MNLKRFFRSDISTAALILANIVTIIVAVVQKWNVADVLWLYLIQSLIIGFFSFLRILSTLSMAIQLLFLVVGLNAFFALFVYSIFGKPNIEGMQVIGYAICIVVFLANHAFSYLYNRISDRKRTPDIGLIGASVLMRIFPMHLTVLLCGWLVEETTQESMSGSVAILVLFLSLKTFVDVTMHNWEHRIGQKVG